MRLRWILLPFLVYSMGITTQSVAADLYGRQGVKPQAVRQGNLGSCQVCPRFGESLPLSSNHQTPGSGTLPRFTPIGNTFRVVRRASVAALRRAKALSAAQRTT